MYDICLSYKRITESFQDIGAALAWMEYHNQQDPRACVECEYITAWGVDIPATTRNLEATAEIIQEYPADLLEATYKLMAYLDHAYTFDETFFILENNCKIINNPAPGAAIKLNDGRGLVICEPIE